METSLDSPLPFNRSGGPFRCGPSGGVDGSYIVVDLRPSSVAGEGRDPFFPGGVLTTEAIRPDGVVIKEIDPVDLKTRLDRGDDLVLVDVRESFERSISDLPDHGQVLIPVKDLPFRARDIDPSKEIVVYCRSGPRSAWATERLMEMGFTRVYNLRGGVMAWRRDVDPSLASY